jgi:hypothetical protein
MDCLPHIHVAAIHADHGYRSFTPGLGVMCKGAKVLFGGGAYKNSLGDTSTYVAAAYQPWTIGQAKVGVIAGAATGYAHYDVVPIAAVMVSYKHLHFTFIPEVKSKTPAVLGISFTFGK